MHSLRVENDRGEVRRIVLDKDSWSIGRGADNDLVLSDINVSRHHARVETWPDHVLLVDTGSSYGIKLNGEFVESEAVLQNGDIFVVGDNQFELILSEEDGRQTAAGTVRMAAVREPEVEADVVLPELKDLADEVFGVPYTVAVAEDESLKILMEMERVASTAPRAGSGSSRPDEVGDDELSRMISGGERKSNLTRAVVIIAMLVAAAVLGWLLYTTFAESDVKVGQVPGKSTPAMIAYETTAPRL